MRRIVGPEVEKTIAVLTICIVTIIDQATCLACLKCESVISPRHCHQIDICHDNEVCMVEKYQNTLHEDLFNVGCAPKSFCFNTSVNDVPYRTQYTDGESVRSTHSSCTQCCSSDLCNSAGCNEQGYPSQRGPLCYNCRQSRSISTCDTITVCNTDEVCHVSLYEEFGERFYTTSCLYQIHCQSNNGNAIFGKRHIESDSLRMICEKCCNKDLCNNNCGAALPDNLIETTKAPMASVTATSIGISTFKPPEFTDTKGKEFWFTFPENYRTNTDKTWNLFIYISSNTQQENTVKVYNKSGFVTYTFNESLTVQIDRQMQLYPNIIEEKGIRVVSDSRVSLVGYSTANFYSSDAFGILPLDDIGVSYIVISFPTDPSYFNFVSILAVQPDTTIQITLNTTSGSVTYNGHQYSTNDTFEVHMKQFNAFQLSHSYDLTGTYVKSNKPVVVQSGCTYANIPGYDTSYYSVFLPPISKLGTSFIMPIFLSANLTVIGVTPISKLTTVNFTTDGKTTGFQLTGTIPLYVPVSKSAVITCSTPCLVAAYSLSNVANFTWNLITLVPSLSQYSRNVTFITPHDTFLNYSHYISITIKSPEVGSLMIDGKSIFSYNLVSDTVSLHGESWSVLSLEIKRGQHSINSFKDIYYGVVAYGLRLSSAYAFPVDMKFD